MRHLSIFVLLFLWAQNSLGKVEVVFEGDHATCLFTNETTYVSPIKSDCEQYCVEGDQGFEPTKSIKETETSDTSSSESSYWKKFSLAFFSGTCVGLEKIFTAYKQFGLAASFGSAFALSKMYQDLPDNVASNSTMQDLSASMTPLVASDLSTLATQYYLYTQTDREMRYIFKLPASVYGPLSKEWKLSNQVHNSTDSGAQYSAPASYLSKEGIEVLRRFSTLVSETFLVYFKYRSDDQKIAYAFSFRIAQLLYEAYDELGVADQSLVDWDRVYKKLLVSLTYSPQVYFFSQGDRKTVSYFRLIEYVTKAVLPFYKFD